MSPKPPLRTLLPHSVHLVLSAAGLTVAIGSCTPIGQIISGFEELCSQSALVVTTPMESTDPEQLCMPGRPCTLGGALSTAAVCGGSRTVVLRAGTTYTLTDVAAPPGALRSRESVQEERVGPVGLPRIFGTVTIEGNGAVIERSSEAPAFRLFHVPPVGNLTLRDLVLRQGAVRISGTETSSAFGGAVYNEGILTAESVEFRGGSAIATRGGGRGGAVYNSVTGTFTASGTLFEGNLAARGGALWNAGHSTLSDSTLMLNRAAGTTYSGSAIHHESGTLAIERSTVSGNGPTTDDAEALLVRGGTVRIEQSTFSANQGTNAGGVWAPGGAVSILRSTFQGNTGRSTGALRCDGLSATVNLQDVTIAANAGGEFGIGGVQAASGCAVTISNTIIALNTAGGAPLDCGFATGSLATTPIRLGNNLDSDRSCGFTLTAPDPLLSILTDNGGPTPTMLPADASLAVNFGTRCLDADQRGHRRPAGSACDIGAVETAAEPTGSGPSAG